MSLPLTIILAHAHQKNLQAMSDSGVEDSVYGRPSGHTPMDVDHAYALPGVFITEPDLYTGVTPLGTTSTAAQVDAVSVHSSTDMESDPSTQVS